MTKNDKLPLISLRCMVLYKSVENLSHDGEDNAVPKANGNKEYHLKVV